MQEICHRYVIKDYQKKKRRKKRIASVMTNTVQSRNTKWFQFQSTFFHQKCCHFYNASIKAWRQQNKTDNWQLTISHPHRSHHGKSHVFEITFFLLLYLTIYTWRRHSVKTFMHNSSLFSLVSIFSWFNLIWWNREQIPLYHLSEVNHINFKNVLLILFVLDDFQK